MAHTLTRWPLDVEGQRQLRRRVGHPPHGPRCASSRAALRADLLAGAANRINYRSPRILAEPIDIAPAGQHRHARHPGRDVLRSAPSRRLGVLADVYNLANSDAAPNITWNSGSAFLRPMSIIGPTIMRFGVKFHW